MTTSPTPRTPRRASRARLLAVAMMCVAAVALAGCSATASADTTAAGSSATGSGTAAATLRLGYFDNVTHAPALIGVKEGLFQKDLGSTALKTEIFSDGPTTIEALSAGAIDAAFLGPGPAISSYAASGGRSIRVISGATNGGSALVVRNGITKASQLKGATLADPQLGNTQDVALRTWLASKGLKTSLSGGGDVTITPTANAQTLTLFEQGKIDGAWLPEPWVSRLVIEGDAHVLVNESSLWKDGAFPTTVLVVNQTFLQQHPQTVAALLKGEIDSVDWLNSHSKAQNVAAINAQLTTDIGSGLQADELTRALGNVQFSVDPLAATFPTQQEQAVKLGISQPASLKGLFDLAPLNALLKTAGTPSVSAGGLGTP